MVAGQTETLSDTRTGGGRSSPLLGRGGLFLTLAAWVLVLEGIHAMLSLLEDVMDGGSSWPVWAYSVVALAAFGAAALLLSGRRWGYFAAGAIALLTAFWPFPAPRAGIVVFSGVALVLIAAGYRVAGDREAVQNASAEVPYRLKLLVVQIVIGIILIRVLLALDFDLEWIGENWWYIWSNGLPLTLWISVLAISLAIILALIGALGRLSHSPVAFGAAGFYASFFRGTPLLVQIFLIYFGLGEIGVRMRGTPLEPLGNLITLGIVPAGVLAIGLNYGAYMMEIFRAGIQSVGHGQAEAADALGMTYALRMRRIVLPQAVRVIIPPTGNEFIAMTKDSSLLFTIGALELFRRGDLVGRADARTIEAFLIVAAGYWALTGILTFFQARLERKMGRGYVRTEARQLSGTKRLRFIPGRGGGPGGGGSAQVAIEVPDEESEP